MESIIFNSATASRRLLIVFAHPDDESFGPAGTIIHYARRGVAVHYLCATRGEAGYAAPELLERYNSLAELRTEELKCAAQQLGLTGLHILDYQDSGMENTAENANPSSLYQAPLEEVARKVVELIRQIQPQVVLTFGPSGGYFHPDHVKMHQAATTAFFAAGDGDRSSPQRDDLRPYQPQKLYYTVFPRGAVKLAVKILPVLGQDPAALGRNGDINLRRMVEVEQEVTTRIKVAAHFRASQRAAQCYVSQASAGGNRFPAFLSRWLFRYDAYTCAFPQMKKGRMEHDLFEGVCEE
jgi:LmbE family N-acetylglucosaminyl deacetylase